MDDTLLNPYIAGAPVLESSMFFGREDVFGWIERSLSGKYVDHILVIHGQRRVGKTSVLKQIPNFLGEEYIQVFFDLQGRVNTSLERFLYWMARETTRTLQQEHGLDIPPPDQGAFEEDAEYLIAEFFPALQSHLNEHVLLLTFDEFDTLAREDVQDSLARPLIAYLRRLMDLEGLSFIFSIGSSGNKLENMQASYTDFFKTALYRKISFLDRVSCQRLITKPVEGDIEYEKGAVNRIYEITAGHPYFTQLTCHELFSLCQRTGSRVIREEDVASVIEDVIERGTVNLKFVWDEASDLEKWVLACLAQLEKGVSNKRLANMLREQRVRFVESDLNSAVLHLREKDVLSKDNTFVVYLMRLWLEQNRPLDRVREELTEVNPIANRFIEIGDEYRDREEFESAIESYRQALGADPKNLRANLNLAQTYLQKADYQKAIEGFEKALNIDPEDVAAQTGLCEAYLALGDREKGQGNEEGAIAYYQKVLTFNESHADARQGLAEIYRDRAEKYLSDGKDDQALQAYNRALEYTPEDEELSARYEEVLAQKKAEVVQKWLTKADRALNRQQWDVAVEAVENALEIDPEDESLQERLVEVKDASRQHQLGIYRDQIDRARAEGAWEEAIGTLQKAIQLAPDEDAFKEQLEEVQKARRQAQLDEFQHQADRALEEEDWDAAKEALREAAELAPDDPAWEARIKEVEEKRFQARLEELRSRAERAKEDGEWGSAIAALEEHLELEPSQEIQDEIEELKARQRQSRLAALKGKAEEAALEERWPAAIDAWQAYLALDPDDTPAAEKALQRAQKYEQIYADYEQAKESLRQKRYGQAVELLQGIIAQDPTYKATSRLLVEAVEARGDVPLWKKPWLYAAVGLVLVVAAGFIFGPRVQASDWFQGLISESESIDGTLTPTFESSGSGMGGTETPTAESVAVVEEEMPEEMTPSVTIKGPFKSESVTPQTPTPTSTPITPTPTPVLTFDEPILDYIEEETPVYTISEYKAEYNSFNAQDFALQFSPDASYVEILFRSTAGKASYYRIKISSYTSWTIESHQGVIKSGSVTTQENDFLLIVYLNYLSLYVNDEPVFKSEEVTPLSGIYLHFEAGIIENVKYWKMDDMDFDIPTPTSTPTPMTPTPTATAGSSSLDAGDTKVSPVDGMTMVYVPAGEFIMGKDDDSGHCGDPSNCPEHQVYLDAFWIDQTEVTNAMYAEFLNDQGVELDGDNYIDVENDLIERRDDIWQAKVGKENYPVIEVTWPGAKAYCGWAGRRLPTEAEWEKAARGTDGRTYPWGEYWSQTGSLEMCSEHANFFDCQRGLIEVGTLERGKSIYGAMNMAGNVKEWVNDTYEENYYQISPYENPQGPSSGVYKVVRGGCWKYFQVSLYIRYWFAQMASNDIVGFRCAQDVD